METTKKIIKIIIFIGTAAIGLIDSVSNEK